MRARELLAALGFFIVPLTGAAALAAEGSLVIQGGPAVSPDGVPDGSVPEWSAQAQLSTRLTGAAPSAAFAFEGCFIHDVVARLDALYLEEAWAAWLPFDGLALRLGRQRLGFGCGFAWSVVDNLDPQPMPFDTHVPRVGLDAVRLSADLSPLGAPVQASVETFAPRAQGAGSLFVVHGSGDGSNPVLAGAGVSQDLQDCGAAAQVSAFLGGIEMGAAGSIKEYRANAPFSFGGWATVDIAGFVFGAEGAWREELELLMNCNKKVGDFVAVAEARWVAEYQRMWLFGQLSWNDPRFGVALSALFTLKEASGLVDLGLSYAASDALVLSLDATLYEKPAELPEIGPVPWRYSLTLGAEYFF